MSKLPQARAGKPDSAIPDHPGDIYAVELYGLARAGACDDVAYASVVSKLGGGAPPGTSSDGIQSTSLPDRHERAIRAFLDQNTLEAACQGSAREIAELNRQFPGIVLYDSELRTLVAERMVLAAYAENETEMDSARTWLMTVCLPRQAGSRPGLSPFRMAVDLPMIYGAVLYFREILLRDAEGVSLVELDEHASQHFRLWPHLPARWRELILCKCAPKKTAIRIYGDKVKYGERAIWNALARYPYLSALFEHAKGEAKRDAQRFPLVSSD